MSNNTHLSTFDRLINIQQSISLNEIKKSNKLLFENQLIQNEKLSQLANQLKQANEINRQILENQIYEIKRTENQIFLKANAHKYSEIIDIIELILNNEIKAYILNVYSHNIKKELNECKEELFEITDKNEINRILNKLNEVIINTDFSGFQNSELKRVTVALEEYNELEVKYNEEINKLKNTIKNYIVPSKGFFGMNKKNHTRAIAERNNLLSKFNKLYIEKTNSLENHNANKLYLNYSQKNLILEEYLDKIQEIELKFNTRFNLIEESFEFDKYLVEVSRFIVKNQFVSVSSINRKFKIGEKRTNRIIEQMEYLGIVKTMRGSKFKEVKAKNLDELDMFLSLEKIEYNAN